MNLDLNAIDTQKQSAVMPEKKQQPQLAKESKSNLSQLPRELPKASSLQGSKLLIVEDDADFCEIIAEFAQEKQYQVITASTGKEALAKAKQEQPSAIILDLGLPDMDGLSVLEELKGSLETRHIPVHVISGRDEAPELKQRGAIGYLKKPATDESLAAVFEKFSEVMQSELKNILLVEDDSGSQQAVRELIDSDKIDIHCEGSGEAAIDYIMNNQIGCVILDLDLPDMSGFDLLKHLVKVKETLPPIVVYTGRDLTKEEHEELNHYTSSIVIKGANSSERLLDEVTLFLHSVESDLSNKSRKVIKMLHSGDQTLHGKKVLLVDDDMRNIFALTSELEDYNLDVIMASNGQQAIEKLAQNPDVDLILMDIMMPVMDGYTAIESIRKDKKHKELPIIALTAKAMPGDRDKCLKSGASDYVSKPIDMDQLISVMKVWLSKS
jgi:CheY-like chemotaxis protein